MDSEPDSLMLQLLRDLRTDMGTVRGNMATERDIDDLRSDMTSLRADVASDLHVTRKEIGEQIVGLRRAVIEYHTSAIGHGVLISEIEARRRRVEQHLNLTAPDPH